MIDDDDEDDILQIRGVLGANFFTARNDCYQISMTDYLM